MTYQCDRISDLSMCQNIENKEGGSIYQVRKWKIETCHYVEIQMAQDSHGAGKACVIYS